LKVTRTHYDISHVHAVTDATGHTRKHNVAHAKALNQRGCSRGRCHFANA
jgi:hypothetical protein